MIKTTVKELSEILNCEVYNTKNVDIVGISRDSREINPNNLFAPIKGDKFDAHDFINDVIQKGVQVSLWDKKKINYPENITLLLVDDVVDSLKVIARNYIKKINPKIIGITGSNGKTSIKDICASILSVSHKVSKTYKNYNNELGLCLSIFMANPDDEFLVLEMGMDNIGDIKKLVSICELDVAIISNIGSAHLEFLKTRENIAKAKLEIIEGLKPNGLFIKPNDEKLINSNFPNIKSFGGETGDIISSNIFIDFDRIRFDTNLIKNIEMQSFGTVQILNALCAIQACKHLGICDEDIRLGIKNTEFTERRNKIFKYKTNYIYDDSYKSNPEGLYKCFETMSLFENKKVAIISDMLELGDNEIMFHEEVAHKAKLYGIDQIFIYGNLSKYTYNECLKLGLNAQYFEDKYDIIHELEKLENSIILFKASNYMKVNEVLNKFINSN